MTVPGHCVQAKVFDFWQTTYNKSKESPWMCRLEIGDIELRHYMSFLVETYHNAGINPQLQATATLFLSRHQKDLHKKFYQHAISEIGHDFLALEDAVSLGLCREKILESKPLPSTLAFSALAFQNLLLGRPLGYLGYLYHLERLPTQSGMRYVELLERKGIPKGAMSFVIEHSTVDVSHNKLMDYYLNELVKSPSDLDELCYHIECFSTLYVAFLSGAFERAELHDWQFTFCESSRSA